MTQPPPITPGRVPEPAPQFLPPVPQPVYAPPPTKKGLSTGAIIGIIAAVLVPVALIVGVCLFAGLAGMAGPGEDDVKVTVERCGTTPAGNVTAEVRVENLTDRTESYIVTVDYVAGSDRFARDTVYITDVPPGGAVRETSLAFEQAPGSFQCKVSDVN